MNNREWCVYITENPNSGKYYIGKSWVERVKNGYNGSGTYIKNCQKSNINLKTQIVLTTSSEKHAYDAEAIFISKHKNKKLCMNLCDDARPPIRYGSDNNKTRPVIDVDTKEVFATSSELSKLLDYKCQNQVAVNLSKGIKCRGRTISWLDEYKDGTWQDKLKAKNAKSIKYSANKRRSTKRRLSPEEARQIYYMKNFSDLAQTEICDIFDVPRHTVYKIGVGKIYKDYLPHD